MTGAHVHHVHEWERLRDLMEAAYEGRKNRGGGEEEEKSNESDGYQSSGLESDNDLDLLVEQEVLSRRRMCAKPYTAPRRRHPTQKSNEGD